MAYSKKQKEKFIEVLKSKNGHVSKACDTFKISRSTYKAWLDLNDWFAKAVEAMKEAEIDDAEDMLRMHRKGVPKYKHDSKGKIVRDEKGNPIVEDWLIKPDPKSTQFYLERKAKERGYGKEQTIKMENPPEMPSVNIGVKVVTPKKKK